MKMHCPLHKLEQLHYLGQLGQQAVPFTLSEEEHNLVIRSFERLQKILEQSCQSVYGIHSGFGADVTYLHGSSYADHQLHLLNYLCVGVGPLLPERVVRRALRLQTLKVAQGYSGIHPETFQRLITLANEEKLPLVPCYGSLGASGDLVPMAHAVRPLFKENPPKGPRDVLALVNTNAMMASLSIECFEQTQRFLELAISITSLVSLSLDTTEEAFLPRTLKINSKLPTYAEIGEAILSERERFQQRLGCIPLIASHRPIQERYSVRCSPQVLGSLLALLRFAGTQIEGEALAVADNPVVLQESDLGEPCLAHAGHFYTASLAVAADAMADVVGKACDLLERQTFLLVTPELNHGLSRNLEISPGDHVKGIHQLISALGQQIRSNAIPARLRAAPSEGYNQDVVPATMSVLLSLDSMLNVAKEVSRAAAFIAGRAAELRYGVKKTDHLRLSSWEEFDAESYLFS